MRQRPLRLSPRPGTPTSRSGAALLLVIAITLMIAALATSRMHRLRRQAARVRLIQTRLQADLIAESLARHPDRDAPAAMTIPIGQVTVDDRRIELVDNTGHRLTHRDRIARPRNANAPARTEQEPD